MNIFRAFWSGIKPYKWLFFLDMLALVVTSTIGVFIPLQYKRFFDVLTENRTESATPELVRIIVFVLILNASAWLAYRIGGFIHDYFQTRAMARLRQYSFGYMVDHSYSFFANHFTGSLVQRVNRFARAFERLTDRLVYNIIPLAITIVGISIILWKINPIITAIVVVWLGSFMIFNYFFSKWKLKYNVAAAEADSQTTAALSDSLTNQNTIQLFTASEYEKKNFKDVTDRQARIANFTWNLNGIIDAVQSGLLVIVEFVLFYFAIRYWQAGVITLGTFVLIQVYFLSLGSKLWDFSRIVRDMYEGFADAKEMVDILDLPHEIRDIPTAKDIVVTQAKIEFKDVLFSFNQTREVIKNINLDIAGGEKVALIGPSGAGKSTFVRLILRLYDVTGGSILIDGQDIRRVTQTSLRANLSLVPQDPILFHRSLKENIRYGRQDATDEELIEAAKLAHCHEFIKDLPEGYDTHVGERGIKLSGGERQRVAIARAILKNAPILILDEATSSLDSESEHLIQDALDTLMKGKTVIVIAHRLSTIRKMDRIVVLDDGRIREEGSHETLLNTSNSLYAKLWSLQAGGFLKQTEENPAEV